MRALIRRDRWLVQQHMGTTFKGIKGSSVSLYSHCPIDTADRTLLLSNLESAPEGPEPSNASQFGKNEAYQVEVRPITPT